MDILRRFLDGKYNAAYTNLQKMDFRMDDLAVGTKGRTKIILGEENVTLVYRNAIEEMTYDSFSESIEKYIEVCGLLKKKGYEKKDTMMGVDIYENENERVLVGRNVKIIFGKTREKLTYDEFISVLTSY